MINLKEFYKKNNKGLTFLWPNWYSVTTVKDFLDNKDFIEPTKNLLSLGVLQGSSEMFFYNSAIVQFENSVTFEKVNYNTGKATDLSSSFEFFMESNFEPNDAFGYPEDGDRLHNLVIKYTPKYDKIKGLTFKKYGPKSRERIKESVFSKDLGLILNSS